MSISNESIITSMFERIAALNETNYRSWTFSMKMLLKAHELWEMIEDDEIEEIIEEKDKDAGIVSGIISRTSTSKRKIIETRWCKKD